MEGLGAWRYIGSFSLRPERVELDVRGLLRRRSVSPRDDSVARFVDKQGVRASVLPLVLIFTLRRIVAQYTGNGARWLAVFRL